MAKEITFEDIFGIPGFSGKPDSRTTSTTTASPKVTQAKEPIVSKPKDTGATPTTPKPNTISPTRPLPLLTPKQITDGTATRPPEPLLKIFGELQEKYGTAKPNATPSGESVDSSHFSGYVLKGRRDRLPSTLPPGPALEIWAQRWQQAYPIRMPNMSAYQGPPQSISPSPRF